MNRILVMVFCVGLCVANLVSTADSQLERLTKHSEKGLFKIEVLLHGQELQVGKNRVELFVTDMKGKEVSGARIRLIPFIYQHGESTYIRPLAAETKPGHYTADNLHIETPGHWVLKIVIGKDDQEDMALFDFPGVKRSL